VNRTYIRYELLRTFRNRRFFIFSFGFPLILFYVIAGPNRNDRSLSGTGISLRLYYMIGLAAFGSMNAMLSTGSRIAAERATGWNRQLRITPLSTRTYFRAKVLTSYIVALLALLLLFIAGRTLGVSLPGHVWFHMLWLMLVCLVPFAVLGILIGHLISSESIGPVIGGSIALFAFLGGVWFPITGSGFLPKLAEALPSYWLVQASHVAIGGPGLTTHGWIVIAAWTIVVSQLARRAYRRDTKRA